MAILLNTVNLLLCLRWFHRSGTGAGRILAIVGAFLGGTVLSFLIALAMAHDYLDGVGHLAAAGVSVCVFWVVALVLLLHRAQRDRVRVGAGDVAILSLVLVVPALIVLLLANMRMKIGG
jgi:heme/copper-type cytochrome/quinol oxidase subunit 2